MAYACGIEFSDFGFNAAFLNADGTPADPPAIPGSAWPGFASWDGSDLIFGAQAEALWRSHPRRTSHTFWEHLSLSPSDLEGPPRTPAYSELAYTFLAGFWDSLVEAHGKPERVVFAVPGQFLSSGGEDNMGLGLILAMARDLGIPLGAMAGLSVTSLNDAQAQATALTSRQLYVDIHLHSAAMSLLSTESDGRVRRGDHLRMPRLGYIPLMQTLMRSMGNRFLRATSFDVTAQRELEQMFYQQTRAHLLDNTQRGDIRYSIGAGTRVHQAAFPRETMLRDLRPLEEGLAEAAEKFVRKGQGDPASVTVVLSSRTCLLPSISELLAAHGFTRVLRLSEGAAARGAARFATESSLYEDIAEVPVLDSVSAPALTTDAATTAPRVDLQVDHVPGGQANAGLLPSHVVVEGFAYSLHALPEELHGAGNGAAPSFAALSRLGELTVKIGRRDGEWVFEAPGSSLGAVVVAPGDRVKLRAQGEEVEMLFAAERRPGPA